MLTRKSLFLLTIVALACFWSVGCGSGDTTVSGDLDEPGNGDDDNGQADTDIWENTDVPADQDTDAIEDDSDAEENSGGDPDEEALPPIGSIGGKIVLADDLTGKASAVMLYDRIPLFATVPPLEVIDFPAETRKDDRNYLFDELANGTYYLLFAVDANGDGSTDRLFATSNEDGGIEAYSTDSFYVHHQSPVRINLSKPSSIDYERDFYIETQNEEFGAIHGKVKLGQNQQNKRIMLMAGVNSSAEEPQFYPMTTTWLEPQDGVAVREYALRNIPEADYYIYAMVFADNVVDTMIYPDPYSSHNIGSENKIVQLGDGEIFHIGTRDPQWGAVEGDVQLSGEVNEGELYIGLYDDQNPLGREDERQTRLLGYQRIPLEQGVTQYPYVIGNLKKSEQDAYYWVYSIWIKSEDEISAGYDPNNLSSDDPFNRFQFDTIPNTANIDFTIPITRVEGELTLSSWGDPSGTVTMLLFAGDLFGDNMTYGGLTVLETISGQTKIDYSMFPAIGNTGEGWKVAVVVDDDGTEGVSEGDSRYVSIKSLTEFWKFNTIKVDGSKQLETGKDITVYKISLK